MTRYVPYEPDIRVGDIFYLEIVPLGNRTSQKGVFVPVEIVNISPIQRERLEVRVCAENKPTLWVSSHQLSRKVSE